METVEQKRTSLKDVGRWALVSLFILSGVAGLFEAPLSGALLVFAGLLLSHKGSALLSKKISKPITSRTRIIGVVALLIISGSFMPAPEPADVTQDNVKETDSVTTQPRENTESVAQVAPKSEQEKLEEKLRATVDDAPGNFGYLKLDVEKPDLNRPVDTKMLTVSVNVTDFYNRSSLLKQSGDLSAKLFHNAFSSNLNAYDVLVWFRAETTDRYGNKEDNVIMVYAMDKNTYSKVNWGNFDSKQLCDFLIQEEKLVGIGEGPACNILVNIE